MITFDKNILRDWKNRDIRQVYLHVIDSGCEGSQIRVDELFVNNGYTPISIKNSDTICMIDLGMAEFLDKSIITYVSGKWILQSDNVLTRCGCGKSFSFKTGNLRQDKLRLLKSKLSKKRGDQTHV